MTSPKRPPFSLIELIVVVAIIAILASMLMPALTRARYAARNTSCMNQLKQIATAWHNYTGDYDDYWPDYGAASPNATSHRDGIRQKSMQLATEVSRNVQYDLRDDIRSYLEATLRNTMLCPLASPDWTNAPSRNVFDMDNYDLGAAPFSQTTYQIFPTGHAGSRGLSTSRQMRRVGDAFVPGESAGNAFDKEFHLLAADVIWEANWRGIRNNLISTQYAYAYPSEHGGNNNHQFRGWIIPPGVDAIANFASDDGSVRTYRNVGTNALNSGEWLRTAGNTTSIVLPAAAAQ